MSDREMNRRFGVGEYLHLSSHHAEPPTWEEVEALRQALRERESRISLLERRIERMKQQFPGLV